jgi:hypothetical protein
VVIEPDLYLYASVEPQIGADRVRFPIPRGSASWFVLADAPPPDIDANVLEDWRRDALRYWDELHGRTQYEGPYEEHIKNSLRTLRLLTNRDSGGVIAAATLGLPEVASARPASSTTARFRGRRS